MKRYKINFSTIKWLLSVAKTVRGSLLFLFIVKVLQGVIGIGFAFLLRAIIDAAVAGDMALFRKCAIIGCLIVVGEVALYWLAIYYKEKPAAYLSKNLRSRIFNELLTRSYADISKVHSGEWMTRINSDSSVIANAITAIVPGTAGLIVQLVCAFTAMFIVLPRVAWILIPIGAAMIIVSLFLRLKLKNFHKEVQRHEGIAYSFLQESLGSMPIVRTYTQEEKTVLTANNKLDGVAVARMKRVRFISTCASIVYALIRISYLLGVIICGTRLLAGVITYGMMAAVLQLIRQADLPLAEVTTAIPQFFNMIASAERLIEIEKLDKDYSGSVKTAKEAREYYEKALASLGFKDLWFSYDHLSEDPDIILSGMDLEIKKGDYVAFTGESGCGKSTTMNLLMGLYKPDKGRLFIKDKESNEMELTPEWRALFAYVPQENLLMSGTIREVVSFAAENDIADEKIWDSLQIACAKEFIQALPEQLDTLLGERGAGLSEGQMQRIAIARAICSERPILMLDEATSALDEQTEWKLLDNLQHMTDRTVVIITHRPAALQICTNRIHYTKNGTKRNTKSSNEGIKINDDD